MEAESLVEKWKGLIWGMKKRGSMAWGKYVQHKWYHIWKCNVGFPSVCYEYVLVSVVNKEAALAYGRAEYS